MPVNSSKAGITGCGTSEAPRKMPTIRQAANKPAARPAGLRLSQRRRSASRTTELTLTRWTPPLVRAATRMLTLAVDRPTVKDLAELQAR